MGAEHARHMQGREGLIQPPCFPCPVHPAMLRCIAADVPTHLRPHLEVNLWAL